MKRKGRMMYDLSFDSKKLYLNRVRKGGGLAPAMSVEQMCHFGIAVANRRLISGDYDAIGRFGLVQFDTGRTCR